MLNATSLKNNNNTKQDTLINAGKKVEEIINREQQYTDLAETLSGSTVETYIPPLLEPMEELSLVKQYELPNYFVDQLAEIQCRCFTGVLPEIGSAWLTIDNKLYIWALDDHSNMFEYDDQDQIIITVGLVKTKGNVFGDEVHHVLVVSTPLEVILLAVMNVPVRGNEKRLQLYATGIVIPADNIQMERIIGTDDGRIFMVSKNGGLYEALYSHPHKWFNNGSMVCRTESSLNKFLPTFTPSVLRPSSYPIVKSITIDNERKVLYILYETSAIEVVYLGDPSNNYLTVFTHENIVDDAIRKSRQQSKFCTSQELQISSIHVISLAESRKIHLLAMTIAGYRLYFSHHKDAFRFSGNELGPPTTLELGYIRSPPQELNRDPNRPPRIYANTYYDCGICLSVLPQSETVDQLVMTAASPAKPGPENQPVNTSLTFMMNTNRSSYVETSLSFNVHDKVRTIIEYDPANAGKHDMKEIAQQYSVRPRHFILLANMVVHVFKKLRPVDILFELISTTRGVQKDASLIQAFFDRYGQVEACAMCLSIICNTDNEQIMARATKLFFEFGGVPSAAYASQVTGNHLGRVIGPTDIHYSGKHDGFILYFARILSPVWKLPVFAEHGNDLNAELIHIQRSRALINTKDHLMRLKHFMDINSHFHDSANIANPRFQTTDRNSVQLELTEQKSVHDLYLLLVQCIEAISFIEFIRDSNAQTIISVYMSSFDNDAAKLYNLDLNTIITTVDGKELTRDIVIATIAKYASTTSHAGFDIVTRQLDKFCHSFFNQSDLHYFRGIEYIRRAFFDESEYERTNSLKESLKHFKAAAKDVSEAKIKIVCAAYKQASFHVGIIELVLERAEQLDPQHQAIIAFETPVNYRDENSSNLLTLRLNTYNNIIDGLSDIYEIKKTHILPENRAPISDIDTYYKTVLDTALSSRDKLFHYQLYNYFITRDAMDELLPTDTEFLIPYLETYVTNKRASLVFLWKFYRSKEQFVNTARCLERLAELPNDEFHVTIEDRVQYLAQAVVNGRCETMNNPHITPYIEDLEKRLQWAQMQARIKSILSSAEGPDAQQEVRSLDQQLFTKAELVAKFGGLNYISQFLQ